MAIFSKKKLLPVIIFLILLISIPLGIYLVKQQQDARSRASEGNGSIQDIDFSGSKSSAVQGEFKKYSLHAKTPETFNLRAIKGTVDLEYYGRELSQLLLSVNYNPTGSCPPEGRSWNEYEELAREYPGNKGLMLIIVKNTGQGKVSVPVDFNFSKSVPVSGCVYAILDGGQPDTGENVVMSMNLKLIIDTDPQNGNASLSFTGDEFLLCSNMRDSNGNMIDLPQCHISSQSNGVRPDQAFAKVLTVNKPKEVYGFYGNISTAAVIPNNKPPRGEWSAVVDYYLYRAPECQNLKTLASVRPDRREWFGAEVYGPYNYFSAIPPNVQFLFNITTKGRDNLAVHETINKTLDTPLHLNNGDCIVALAKGDSNGGLTMESQINALDVTQNSNAQFIKQTVPAIMVKGRVYNISVTMKNNGQTSWTKIENFRLGIEGQEKDNWGIGRVELSGSGVINPNQEKTFNFNVTAPNTPGRYNFQWRMLQEEIEWFGTTTQNIEVQVVNSDPPINELIRTIIQNFLGSGNGDQNGDGKINELDFGSVYSK